MIKNNLITAIANNDLNQISFQISNFKTQAQ